MVLYLKEHHQVALHVACGDITDVKMDGDKLRINVTEQMLANLLEEGRTKIEQALRWQGIDVRVEIFLKEKMISKSEQDINKLNSVFNEIKIIKNNWR